MYNNIELCKKEARDWYFHLRDSVCQQFENIEERFGTNKKFQRKAWSRLGGGGGEMSIMHGDIFEKVGVNISTVFGSFNEKFAKEIPGAEDSRIFWACGVSIVAHMKSPFVPAIHTNTRFIVTEKCWFGGGTDLTPAFRDEQEKDFFHQELKKVCDQTDVTYYPKFKEECDRYFFLPHRNEARGVGGIFYDYLNTGAWEKDFAFNKNIGQAMPSIFTKIVENKVDKPWTEEDKEIQLIKRGKYVEFNLLYDRGTRFGLMTNGNTEAVLMSLPPYAKW
ncbi:MAG: Coproporphyrinogen III oxidase [Candidatus Midichloria mitochondrii]|uniref:coproporphyrinogen oxidase n=1 Tax=Midichloria mitochondrii (strain IricVA) TaxID=696127 RepID=F7XV24_MIDMI|nr:oxygen-dependent coproporphyrinogen oxidase [Candidatus Midichloria mitochondrii]AEI88523.1 coproporphyrinogen III oxidase [Candidatus Midichloria mitochondrii IricVA]MDJ1256033.1 oxygen-dependent coproporphyrinogen oxidase [Candidatus Midichloria mitochondrii]MDJ1287732.1 oxygen-dependent coproporphyrinogen oxidase [Candidatus Midichloria mitochondrii]MDJ1298596.1 oxygen-dependent coproporphyrinogen oxidase [Candidatus Midichloria mitochondrii]MDJ1312746.1 oxygen-dependent coproporphyrinog